MISDVFVKNPNKAVKTRAGAPRKLTNAEAQGRILKSLREPPSNYTIQSIVKENFNVDIMISVTKAQEYGFQFFPKRGTPYFVKKQAEVHEQHVADFYVQYDHVSQEIPFYLHFHIDETAIVGSPDFDQKTKVGTTIYIYISLNNANLLPAGLLLSCDRKKHHQSKGQV